MDQKWKYDLSSLLRLHKPHDVLVTCKGSDNGFVEYQNAIISRFAQQPVIWKRHGKPFQYPLTFPIKFCAFDESLCFGPHVTQSDLPNIAYLHVYVIDSASVDEYRTSVRHNVSEWFAKVSSKSDVQWLIIVDSTRAKEKKNRPSLLEKLRHDFSKHTSKLIEVSESVEHGSFVSLVQAVQNALFAHFDILSDTWEASLSSSRGKYTDMDWNLSSYYCSTMEYARLFWSLGAYEHALTLYDELDQYLFEIVEEIAVTEAGREPRWAVSLRSQNLPFLSLYSSFEQSKIDFEKNHSLIAIRHFLVAQQILLNLYIYNARHRSRGAAPSLRVDFAALILKYTKHVLDISLVQSRTALINVSTSRLACWSLVISNETLHIAGLLAEPSTIEGAAASVCAIQLQRFSSMLDLSNLSESDTSEARDLRDWLSVNDSSESPEFLREMLQSSSSFTAQLSKAYDTATATLLQWGRNRQAVYVGWRMAEWMRKNSRDAGALRLEMRFISSLLSSGCHTQVVVDVMKRVVSHLNHEDQYDKLLEYRLFIALHAANLVDRKIFAEYLIEQLEKRRSKQIRMAESVDVFMKLFRVRVTGFTPIVQISNDASIDFELTSLFPIPINNLCLRVTLGELDQRVQSLRQPVCDVVFSERDRVCRVLTLNKSQSSVPPLNSKELLLTCSNQLITTGQNVITVTGVTTARGCFVLHSVEAVLFNDALSIDITCNAVHNFVTIFVQSMPNMLWIDDSKDLLAGVAQQVRVTIESATSVFPSKLEVYAEPSGSLEFMGPDEVWSPKLNVDIPLLISGTRHTFELVLCLLMDAGLTASPAVRKAKVCFDWFGKIWSLELPFVALLIMTSSTSMLENKTLFELEVARAVGHAEEWTVVIENAVIEALDPSAPEGTPNKLGRLINGEVEELIPNVVSSLVWVLPLCGELPISHKLSIDYRVKPTKESISDEYRKVADRLYSYRETFDLHVPRVAYELCAQMLSHQPGAQLCRAGTACDLVISLRSMIPYVELLYIVLDADEKLWTLSERAKVLQVKESGLGQIAFSVVPCSAGFLPYPSVSVYSCKSIGPRVSDTWTEGVDIVPGIQLLSFLRTGGKQIRVLSASHTCSETVESKKGLKHKLGKLFD